MSFAPDRRTLLSAVLLTASLPPWDLGFLVWVALVPWLSRLRSSPSFADSAIQGFWLSLLFSLGSAHWLAIAIHEFLSVGWPLSIFGLIVFGTALGHPHLVVFAICLRWAEREAGSTSSGSRVAMICVALGLLYAGLDWIIPRLFDVGLGYALHGFENLRQAADVGGVRLLTCLVVTVNLLISRADAMRRPTSDASVAARPNGLRVERAILVGTAAVLVGCAFFYGLLRNRELHRPESPSDRLLQTSVVQGSVPNQVRLAWARGDDRAAEKQLSTYMLLTEEIITRDERPDLVVWPEATFPGVFQKPTSKVQIGRTNKFDRQILRLNTPIVFGSYDLIEEDGRRTLFNTLFAITPDYDRAGRRGLLQRYHKHELLPFAETIPGLSEADWLRALLPGLGLFGRGPGAEVLEIALASGGSIRLSPIICSESLHARHVIEGVRAGGEVLVNIGSDGWFGDTGGPLFHLAVSRFRSIETRRPQIRAANSGISALILPDGSIQAASDLNESRILDLAVPVGRARSTLMLEWGDWFGPSALVGSVLLAAVLLVLPARSSGDDSRSSFGGASDPTEEVE